MKLLLWLAVPFVLATGCRAEPPPPNYLDGTIQDQYVSPDFPQDCPSPPLLQAPILDQHPNSTSYALQPFRGTAQGASFISAKSSAGAAAPQTVGSDGKFCIEVRLIEDAQNTVTFTPLDARGCPGQTVQVSIFHKTVPNQDAGATSEPFNVALNAPISANPAAGNGTSAEKVVDGDQFTWASFSFTEIDLSGKCDKYGWLQVDLGKTYTISKFIIRWPPTVGTNYARCYTILLSNSTAPGDPDPTNGYDWIVAKEETVGNAQTQTITIPPESARIAALLYFENGSSGWIETFHVAEFEVWGQDPDVVPPPPPDRCD
ncbi:MAG: discoidin domain-containing protein [Pseudomonadota bacterium]